MDKMALTNTSETSGAAAMSSEMQTPTQMPTQMIAPEFRWDDEAVAGLSEAEVLRYRSNLLGADLAVTNFGGGNTSSKIQSVDPLTRQAVDVLWVKGSGGDLGSMGLSGFSTLYLEKLLSLEQLYRGLEHEDEMVDYLPHCTFNLNPRAPSIDTPLHAYVPVKHVDHTHPDAVIAIAASRDSQALTRKIYGDDFGWLPWRRPGFDLGLRLRDQLRAKPSLRGVVLEGHGLFTWADDQKACYANTIETISKAAQYINDRLHGRKVFGGPLVEFKGRGERERLARRLMPAVRNQISQGGPKIGHFSQAPAVLEFVNGRDLQRLADIGTSCPDHFLRTKIKPLMIDPARFEAEGDDYLSGLFAAYRADYQAYYERCKRPTSPAMRDGSPVIYLAPGVGMMSFAGDKATARVAAEFYANAINVIRGAEAVSSYMGLPEQEAFDIEYWLLEEAKLQRMPEPKPFSGRIVLITGGAGGIGSASARAFLEQGACVVLTDLDGESLDAVGGALRAEYGEDKVRAVPCDVTEEDQVKQAFGYICAEYGGLDVLVANAGIASSASIEDTTVALWRKNFAVLSEGYFLTSREAFRIMKPLGGSIVFVASKNALAASPNASAYAASKASELHLARCLALEGAPHGIRVNTVNPDAVLAGSKIWTGKWREERAAAYGLNGDELQDHYRNRSLLKRNVLPDDIASAIVFLASESAAKSTGNIINVDAGNAAAFPR